MGRIKPAALLIQSKKKKGPAKINLKTIITCNLVLIVVVLSLYAVYKHWYQRSIVQPGDGLEDIDEFYVANITDRPGHVILNTSKGSVTLELKQDASPEVVDRFLTLCKKGYFNGMSFQRVIKHYVIQGGDVEGLGTVEEWTSKSKPLIQPSTRPRLEAFTIGTSKTNEGSDEFPIFITTAPIPELSEKLTVFGRVVEGEDVVQEIEEVDTDEHYQPKSPVKIVDVIFKNGS